MQVEQGGEFVEYHVQSYTITPEELAVGINYTLTGDQYIQDEEVTRIFVMWNNWPLTGEYLVTGDGEEWSIDVFVDNTKFKTGHNEYVLVYQNASGARIAFDSRVVQITQE
jgi:hypothetical protein